jgi:hypothetical protein
VVDKLVYFLMKRRLSKDENQEPPLFPWETEVKDYPEETTAEDADPTLNGHSKSDPPPDDAPSDRQF